LAAFGAVVLAVGLLVVFLVGRATREEFHLYTTAVGQRQAERLAPLLADYYARQGTWDGVEDVLAFSAGGIRGMHGMGGGRGTMSGDMWQMMGMQLLVANATGQIVADSAGELVGKQIDADSIAYGEPIWLGSEQIGTALVTTGAVASSLNDSFLKEVNQATLLAVLVAGTLALLLGGVITWGITRPIRRLTEAAEAIASGDLSQRVPTRADDEVGDLARAFNQMAAELQHAEDLRRQMTADIAHELRTPITVIQGNVEALQDGVFPLTPEALAPIQTKTALLARLVEDLRHLALAEAGQLPLDCHPTDLTTLVRRTVVGFGPAAEAKSVRLELAARGTELPLTTLDPQRIEQVLVNLLSNALRHTPAGGTVTIELGRQDSEQLLVRITDTGSGIPAQDLPNVFERFYRVDRGRGRGDDGGGSGLGLAVARSIIRAHGGTIGVSSPPGEGAIFWFTLPVAGT
jgi:two-component system OmpR family sensor kinase/two-component system sensor histidine kinase BaeS